MSSSEDDAPLVQKKSNGVKSRETIAKSVDKAMDKQIKTNGDLTNGVSIRNGPVDKMEVDGEAYTNGANSKRKSRGSTNGRSYKEASSEDEDDAPLNKRRKTSAARRAASDSDSDDKPLTNRQPSKIVRPPKTTAHMVGEDSDSDTPVMQKLAKEKAEIEKAAARTAKSINRRKSKVAESSDDDDVPLVKAKPSKRASNGVKKEASDDEAPKSNRKKVTPSKAAKAKVKKEEPTPKKGKSKAVVKDEEEDLDEEEESRWWDAMEQKDGTIKWNSLEHNGVVFPPPYQPLPKNVKFRYDAKPITLHPEAEEVAGFYGTMLNSEVNVSNDTFNKNFFDDFKQYIKKTGGAKDREGKVVKIDDWKKCDFKDIFNYYDAEREKKRNASKEEKKALKEKKDKDEAPYTHCIWDGRKQQVGNFRVEPPGLFRGRGQHPKTGRVKTRVMPEQVTINIGKNAKVPAAPAGHKWREVKHDQEITWLASWTENINGNIKYVMLAANSDIKGQSDWKKFEKARELKKYIENIRKDYNKEMKSAVTADRQLATACYLIDKLALRAGNEKGEDEAETVGCCSLKCAHVTLKPGNVVCFDFLGKDSIRYQDEVAVDPQVWKNIKIFKKAPKEADDDLFDRLDTSRLNKHLSNYMAGLTAKVFRTYNASWTMSELLKKMEAKGTIAEKLLEYNAANRKVAILCNHKRTVAAGHAGAVEKMGNKINTLAYQQWRVKMMMLDLDPKLRKKKGADFFARPEELTDDVVANLQELEVEELRVKIRKKFDKENEKLAAEGEKEMKPKELGERLKDADELATKYKKENKSGKVLAEGKGPTVEKLEAQLEKMQTRELNAKVQLEDKEENKEVALGTSKINYIDPRLTVVFCKKFDVPIERVFSKTLRNKFEWAIKSVDENWEF